MATIKSESKSRKSKSEDGAAPQEKLTNKVYEKELARLHAELVKLQLWVVAKGLKVVVVFEGRDGAGKGGVIKAITERVSPRSLSRRRAARADRTGKVADVRPAIHAAFAGRRARS